MLFLLVAHKALNLKMCGTGNTGLLMEFCFREDKPLLYQSLEIKLNHLVFIAKSYLFEEDVYEWAKRMSFL